jgi:ADP-heptose:LPS heptosyltransferase
MCASPLPLLKKKFGHVEVITQQPQGVVFQNNPHVDKLSFIEPSAIPQDSSGNWQNYWAGRSKEYDAFFNLSHSCETTRALFVGQTHFHWPASFRRKFCGANYLETVHDICEVPHEFAPLFYPTDAEREQAVTTKKKVGERCVVWIISGTRLDKLHPYSSFVIAQLIREVGPVIMLGAPGKDFGMAKAIQDDVIRYNGHDTGLHLGLSPDPANPTWGIRRVLTQAFYGDVVIGPDTGPMWGVAFEDVPKIMLLSHASADNITKHWKNTVTLQANATRVPCHPCHQLHDTVQFCVPNRDKNGAACISDIQVQTIVRETKELWDGKGSYGVKMQA